jgi:hypothetical protein
MQTLIFRITTPDHTYSIFSDGRIEGFESGAIVENFYPQLVRSRFASAKGILDKPDALNTRPSTADDGASHLVPA